MHERIGIAAVLVLVLAAGPARAVMVDGGGPKRKDCVVQLMSDGVGFPAGKPRLKGVSCSDGDFCDADGRRDGVCRFLVLMCTNQASPALTGCAASEVTSVTTTGRLGKGKSGEVDTSAIDAAVGAMLPTSAAGCSEPVEFDVPVAGPNGKGDMTPGRGEIRATAVSSRGKDKDRYRFTCLPSGLDGPTTTSTTTPSTVTTIVPGTTTSTTTQSTVTTTSTTLPTFGAPGPGLEAEITDAAVAADGTVTVTFLLTDAAGVPLEPTTSSTDDPAEARVRMTIARLEVVEDTTEGFTTDFTRYRNYVTSGAAAQPAYDTAGEFGPLDPVTRTRTYTFATKLPAGFPAGLTHTVGAQVERGFESAALVANPLFDFVPAGGAVTTMREVTTTAQCNRCHDPLAVHGGGRREVQLCQLCHTDQSVDPDTGNTLDLKHMIHRVHRGKNLPSVVNGALGAKYAFIGFNGQEIAFGEKVAACSGGALKGLPCEDAGDCPGGTCTAGTTVGVGFPPDLRDCSLCHTDGADAPNHETRANALACTGCHDDVNPGDTPTDAGPPGTGHIADDQPDALCRLCHTASGEEFDDSVPGAHVIPERSAQLRGLSGEILSAAGTAEQSVTLTFRFRNGDDGSAVTNLAEFNRLALNMSGPTTDLGGTTPPFIGESVPAAGGMLTGPDGQGVFTYVTNAKLPAGAEGSWRIGMEARRPTTIFDPDANPISVNESPVNPILDFSVDGSPVVPRRTVVTQERCERCHGPFSRGFSIHGGPRDTVEYCVICHNPSVTDFARRRHAFAMGGEADNEPINLKHLLHKIHSGEELEHHPYVVYGFGSGANGFTPFDFAEVRFPGDRGNCGGCHVDGSELLPLPGGLLPTKQSFVDVSGGPAVETVSGSTPPVQDACLACHDSEDAAAHAETNTTAGGAEACTVCHGEGSMAAVSAVHARE
jgi:OmcA/MtrC family decaheme c-type cytochrome